MSAPTAAPVDIAVVTALPEESAALRAAIAAEPVTVSWVAGGETRVYRGATAAGLQVAVVATGAGKVAATEGMFVLLTHFHPAIVFATGIAGAVSEEVSPGDLVLATRTASYDVDATALGIPLGTLRRGASTIDEIPEPGRFGAVVPWLERAAESAAAELPGTPAIHRGLIASGDTLLTRRTLAALPADWRDLISDAVAVDMESAVWARCARRAAVPLILYRLVSDHVTRGEQVGFVRACEETGVIATAAVNACRRAPDGAIVSE